MNNQRLLLKKDMNKNFDLSLDILPNAKQNVPLLRYYESKYKLESLNQQYFKECKWIELYLQSFSIPHDSSTK